jgi:hypothetical protein
MAYKNPEDQKAWMARDYQNNKAKYYERNKKRVAEMRAYIQEYKESRGCTDCGVKYPFYVLHLDHLPGFEKKFDIAKLGLISSMEKLNEELAKCEVVCANCHAKRTYERRFPMV